MAIFFEWDKAKNEANRRKHGIDFEEAIQIFDDPFIVSEPERIVEGEERWKSYGMIRAMVLVMVAHLWMDDEGDERIRVISAR